MDTWVCVGMQGVQKCARLCGSMCIVCGLGISNNGIVSFRAYQNDLRPRYNLKHPEFITMMNNFMNIGSWRLF